VPRAIEIETARLRLRQWRESDRAPFAAMNADAEVMEFFASLQSREASDASIDAWRSQFAERGWSNWAVEVLSSSVFIGFVGLSIPKQVLPFSPCVEVARAALRVGFERLELAEIISFTSVLNSRSRAVMERIGMRNAHEDFEYPGVPENHSLRPHCLYRITRGQWSENAAHVER